MEAAALQLPLAPYLYTCCSYGPVTWTMLVGDLPSFVPACCHLVSHSSCALPLTSPHHACLSLGLPQLLRKVPPTFTGSLRPYQQEGYQWLVSRYLLGESGILADVSQSVAESPASFELARLRLSFLTQHSAVLVLQAY